MKRFFTFMLSAGLCAAVLGTAVAKPMSAADVAAAVKSMAGTYDCTAGTAKTTSTFSPLFGGRAFTINDGTSQEQIGFDMKRQKWFDEHIDSDGNYGTFDGTPNGPGNIDFVATYPQGFHMTVKVRTKGKVMTTTIAGPMNGKMQRMVQTCVKR